MKLIVLLAVVFCSVECQRPYYAGSPNRYPVVLPQFLEEREKESVANRIGGVEGVAAASSSSGNLSSTASPATSTTPTTSTIPPNLPVDAMGDYELIKRIETWPRDKQPFWYLNWRQIEAHRAVAQPAAPQVNQRSFYAG